jgi:formylglycine-generating enzyme required for sulfatase activity
MAKLFISYRRADSEYPAGQIYRELCNRFGAQAVVFDVDSIPLGIDFREYLNDAVGKCDVLLAVIGDRWLEMLDQRSGRPDDFVRIEIQAALERNIPVVPVLVGRAMMPAETELPPELAPLAYRNAAEVRAGRDLETYLKRLVSGLERLPDMPRQPAGDAEGKAPAAVERTITNRIGMTLVFIQPGTFTMGSPASESGREEDEKQHEVTLTRGFYLQTPPVTQGQWQAVMGDNPSEFKKCGDDCPVETVSWDDVQAFIKKLNAMDDDRIYRLPTEAEWEYACRGGSTTVFCFGDSDSALDEYAWFGGNSKESTHPVGQKKPNAWGLYDMHGNVWEWCQDWYADYPGKPVRDPVGPGKGSGRVCRGHRPAGGPPV